jgi:hypothetical protein
MSSRRLKVCIASADERVVEYGANTSQSSHETLSLRKNRKTSTRISQRRYPST